ncbi:ABC transporter substrate-binding protein [Myxococcota bacterium]
MHVDKSWIMGLAIALNAASCDSDESNQSNTAALAETGPGQTIDSDESNQSNTAALAETGPGQTIDLLTYWVSPGQAERVQRLIDLHRSTYPDDEIINDARASTNWDALLAERIAAGNTPNLYVQQSADVAGFLQKNGADSLQSLDDFLALPSQATVVLNLASELVAELTVDGKMYGLPAGWVSRANALFYNKHVFRANQLNPPTTVDEFLTVCQKFKAVGQSCVTTTFMTLLFEGLLAGVMGIDAYDSYRRGGSPDETALRKGIDVFAEVIDNYLDPAAFRPVDGTLDAEVEALMSGQAAMYTIVDVVKSSLQQLGWTAGVDFGVTAAPGNAGLFVYAADVFTIPTGASHLEGALGFLATSTSTEGQLALLGTDSTPARMDIELAQPDSEEQGIITDWRQAQHRLAANTKFVWEGPLQAFVHSTPHDKEALLQVLLTVY